MYKDRNRITSIRSLISMKFLLSVFILVLAAKGLQPAMETLSERYTKKSIPIRRSLKEFDISRLPTFRDNWDFIQKEPDVSVEALGTDEYLIMELKRKGDTPKCASVVVTYYSDPQDKVPHTPEMCYTQIGAIIKKTSIVTIDTPELAPDCTQIRGRLLIFDMPNSDLNRIVLYCFCVEGKIRLSRNQVRLVIGQPGNHYTYFSKIEGVLDCPSHEDSAETIEICKTLFRETISVLLTEYFPDKKQLRSH